MQDGQKVNLDAFRKGMRVQITFESQIGEKRLIEMSPTVVTAEEVQKEINDVLQAAKLYTYQQKKEYQRRLKHVLERVDDRIDTLRGQAARAGAETKKRYAKQIQQLSRLRDQVQEKMEHVKSATPDAWEDVKTGMKSAFEDLRSAFEKAAEHFRSHDHP